MFIKVETVEQDMHINNECLINLALVNTMESVAKSHPCHSKGARTVATFIDGEFVFMKQTLLQIENIIGETN